MTSSKGAAAILEDLNSQDLMVRDKAIISLKDSFDDHVAERILRILIVEHAGGSFKVICHTLIPKWIVMVERTLDRLDEWPFEPTRTAWLVRSIRGWRLPSYERQVSGFLRGDEWILKLSAVNYCHNTMTNLRLARGACLNFLEHKFESDATKLELAQSLEFRSFRQMRAHYRRYADDFAP